MKIATAAQMRAIEARTAGECKVPLLLLMEHAGRAVADAVQAWLAAAGRRSGPVVVCAGRGNNGGDGLVAARHLLSRGVAASVLLFADPGTLQGDAATNLAAALGSGVPVFAVAGSATGAAGSATGATGSAVPVLDPAAAAERLAGAALVIDALLGTGANGAPRGAVAGALAAIAAAGRPVLAVDLPTGVESDSGQTPGAAVRAVATVTFGLPKWGHYLYPGAALCGGLTVADIGFPPRAVAAENLQAEVLEAAQVAGWLPVFAADAHKGTRGRVVAAAGSLGMIGAAVLCSRAALRAGCGLARLLTPASVQPQAAAHLLEVTVQPVADNGAGAFAGEAAARVILAELAGADAAVVGPGLSRSDDAFACARAVLAAVPVPAVLDADGIVAFAGRPEALRRAPSSLVLTPHPGELALLLGSRVAAVQADRVGALHRAAAATGATVVLKGAHTLVGTPDGRTYVNPTGNPGMGTGGSGDVLAGVIAALLAQGLAPAEAAAAGVYLHGLAGDLAAARRGPDGLLAGDLLDELPLARRQVREAAGA